MRKILRPLLAVPPAVVCTVRGRANISKTAIALVVSCCTVFSALSSTSAQSQTVSSTVGQKLAAVQTALAGGDSDAAVADLLAIQSTGGLSDYETYLLNRFFLVAYIKKSDMLDATTYAERAANSSAIPAKDRASTYTTAIKLDLLQKQYDQASRFAQLLEQSEPALDTESAKSVAQAYYFASDYTAAETAARKYIQTITASGQTPDRLFLDILMSAQVKLQDQAGARQTLRQIAELYQDPKDIAQVAQLGPDTPASAAKASGSAAATPAKMSADDARALAASHAHVDAIVKKCPAPAAQPAAPDIVHVTQAGFNAYYSKAQKFMTGTNTALHCLNTQSASLAPEDAALVQARFKTVQEAGTAVRAQLDKTHGDLNAGRVDITTPGYTEGVDIDVVNFVQDSCQAPASPQPFSAVQENLIASTGAYSAYRDAYEDFIVKMNAYYDCEPATYRRKVDRKGFDEENVFIRNALSGIPKMVEARAEQQAAAAAAARQAEEAQEAQAAADAQAAQEEQDEANAEAAQTANTISNTLIGAFSQGLAIQQQQQQAAANRLAAQQRAAQEAADARAAQQRAAQEAANARAAQNAADVAAFNARAAAYTKAQQDAQAAAAAAQQTAQNSNQHRNPTTAPAPAPQPVRPSAPAAPQAPITVATAQPQGHPKFRDWLTEVVGGKSINIQNVGNATGYVTLNVTDCVNLSTWECGTVAQNISVTPGSTWSFSISPQPTQTVTSTSDDDPDPDVVNDPSPSYSFQYNYSFTPK